MTSIRVLLAFAAMTFAACSSPDGGVMDAPPCKTSEDCGGGACVDGRCAQTDASSFDVSPSDVSDAADVACPSVTFPMTETQVAFAVPDNVRYMHVKAWGAGGNDEGQCGKLDGGLGGFTEAVFEVKPGDPLIVIVGKRGRAGVTGEERARFGFGEWGGGGLSGVFMGRDLITDKDQAKALVIAGGGGSAGAPGCHPGGTGNHPTAGGMPTMQGGTGADEINGGAGGYFGGKGGAKGQASKGGTGYVRNVEPMKALDSRMLYVEALAPKPPRADDPDYDGTAGTPELSGLVVIRFTCGRPEIR